MTETYNKDTISTLPVKDRPPARGNVSGSTNKMKYYREILDDLVAEKNPNMALSKLMSLSNEFKIVQRTLNKQGANNMATTPTAPATPEVTTNPNSPVAAPAAPALQEQLVFNQTFSFKIPKNQDGVKEIFSDPATGEIDWKALVYALRAGIKQIVNNRVRQKFTEKEKDTNKVVFEPVEGMFDATSLLLDAPQRNVRSQREKLEMNLKASNLPQAIIDQMLSTFDANVGTASEAGNTSVQTSDAKVSWSKDGKKLVMTVGSSSGEDEEEEEGEETAA